MRKPFRARRDGGFSLLVILLMMVVLAFIGLGAMNSSLLQERMAGNASDQNLAMQAAEAALRDAESDIEANFNYGPPYPAGCHDGICGTPSMNPADPQSRPVWDTKSVDWSDAGSVRVYGSHTGAAVLPGVKQQPRYIVEQLIPLPIGTSQCSWCRNAGGQAIPYRITVRATGQRDSTVVMLQSTYIKQ